MHAAKQACAGLHIWHRSLWRAKQATPYACARCARVRRGGRRRWFVACAHLQQLLEVRGDGGQQHRVLVLQARQRPQAVGNVLDGEPAARAPRRRPSGPERSAGLPWRCCVAAGVALLASVEEPPQRGLTRGGARGCAGRRRRTAASPAPGPAGQSPTAAAAARARHTCTAGTARAEPGGAVKRHGQRVLRRPSGQNRRRRPCPQAELVQRPLTDQHGEVGGLERLHERPAARRHHLRACTRIQGRPPHATAAADRSPPLKRAVQASRKPARLTLYSVLSTCLRSAQA